MHNLSSIVTADIGYPIIIANDVCEQINQTIDIKKYKKIVIISDDEVADLYVDKLKNQFNQSKVQVIIFKSGESSKNVNTWIEVIDQMFEFKHDRYSLCIALGGGVVGDLSGFVAASYMRGIDYIQVPTTLLSMVDSSIGGKTAVNSKFGKNLIGSFYPPIAVLIDPNFLLSLPKVQIVNGLIEIIKIFLTSDAQSFTYLKINLDKILKLEMESLLHVLKRAIGLKAEVVLADEREENLRMILNFGHTIGHAIEKAANYRILHGYAVALGILLEAEISHKLGFLDQNNFEQIIELFKQLGIDKMQLHRYDVKEMLGHMSLDKKNKNGELFCVLLDDIGEVHLDNQKVATKINYEIIKQVLI